MQTKISITFFLLLLLSSVTSAQDFLLGIESGINYSNIKKSFDYDRLKAQPGPVNGLFVKYSPNNWFAIQSGIKHVTFFYDKTSYHYHTDFYPISSYPSYYFSTTQNKQNFLRLPLLVKFRTPGRLNLEFGGGIYYSILTNDEYRGKDKDLFTKEFRDEHFPPLSDIGWILASTINYDFDNRLNIFLNGQITAGKEEYYESVKGKTGSTEVTVGIGYKLNGERNNYQTSSSRAQNIQIIPHSGINISNTKSTENSEKYKSVVGLSTGISIKFNVEKNFSIVSGAWYERKGYNLNYTGEFTYIYRPPFKYENQNIPELISNVKLDYITFPFMVELNFGNKIRSNFNFGTYFSLQQNAFTKGQRIKTEVHSQGYQTQKEFFDESLEQWFNRNDAGFMAGYRMEIPLFYWGNLFFAVNQSMGVKDIFKDLDTIEFPGSFQFHDNMYNSSTSFMVGFNIPVTKNELP